MIWGLKKVAIVEESRGGESSERLQVEAAGVGLKERDTCGYGMKEKAGSNQGPQRSG